VCDIVVKKFTSAISSDEFLLGITAVSVTVQDIDIVVIEADRKFYVTY